MKDKLRILAKLFLIILMILLIFSVMILLSYENQYKKSTKLIDNGNISEKYNIKQLVEQNQVEEPETSTSLFVQNNNNENFDGDENEERSEEENNSELPAQEPSVNIGQNLFYSIIPNDNNLISGITLIKILEYPAITEEILIMISPEGSNDPINDENTIFDFLEQPFNEDFVFDSVDLDNGNYLLTIAATYDEAPENDPWVKVVRSNIVIEN